MPILITKTYSIVDEESLDLGDFAETGYVFEDEPMTFHELVKAMKEHNCASQYLNDGSPLVWLSSDWDMDFTNGEETQTAIHYSHSNPSRNAKYWRLAMKAAGILD